MKKLPTALKVGMLTILVSTALACLSINFVPVPTASLDIVGPPCNIPSLETSSTPVSKSITLPVTDGTPVPQPLEAMSSNNAARVVRLARWGRGVTKGITWSPDGKLIAMTTSYGVYFFNSNNLSLEGSISANEAEAYLTSAFSSDGRFLAIATISRVVQLWQVSDATLIREFILEEDVIDLALSSDGSLLGAAENRGKVRLWQTNNGNLVHEISTDSNQVEFSPSGEIVATVNDEILQLWRVRDGTLAYTLDHGDFKLFESINAITFNPDKQSIVTISSRGVIRIWQLSDGKMIRQFDTGDFSLHITFSPDGKWLVTDDYSTVNLYRVSDGGLERRFQGRGGPFAFSPDNQFIAAVNFYGTIQVLATNDGHTIGEIEGNFGLSSLAISPNGGVIVTGGAYLLKARDTFTGHIVCMISAHEQTIFSLAYSPDATLIASGGYDGAARVWQSANGKLLNEFKPEVDKGDNLVYIVTFSPDGKLLAVGNTSESLFLYNVVDGKLIARLDGHHARVDSIAFSPDGQMIAAAGYDTVKLWQVNNGRLIRELSHKIIASIAFSSDGNLLAAAGSRDVKVWRVSDGEEIYTLGGHKNVVESVTFSPVGDLLASGSADGFIRMWSIQNGALLVTLASPVGSVENVSFTPDGRLLISVSTDGTVGLWGVQP